MARTITSKLLFFLFEMPLVDDRSQRLGADGLARHVPLALARVLPRDLCHVLHPQLASAVHGGADESDPTLSPRPREHFLGVVWRYATGQEKDGIWDWRDPVPFFVLCHLQWPWLLLRLIWRRVAWSRVNVSTSRVFEC